MRAKSDHTPARVRGLVVALLVNAALLALLAVGPQARLQFKPETPSNTVALQIVRPPPQAVEPERSRDAKALPQVRPSAIVKPPPTATTTSAVTPPVLQAPPQTAPVAAPAGAAAAQGAVSDKGAAAVRHLLGCAAFASGRRRDGDDCGAVRSGEAGHIEGLTPEKRLGLGQSGPMRRDELVETNRELQTQTEPPRGSAVRYGCGLKYGKWKCSTY